MYVSVYFVCMYICMLFMNLTSYSYSYIVLEHHRRDPERLGQRVPAERERMPKVGALPNLKDNLVAWRRCICPNVSC